MRKKINHIISIVLTIGVLLLSLNFTYSFIRIKDVIFDFINCLGVFSNETLGTNFNVKLNIITQVYDIFEFWFPLDWNTLKNIISDYFIFLFQKETLIMFWYNFLEFILILLQSMLVVIPFILILKYLLETIYFKQNDKKPNEDSKYLTIFKNTILRYYLIVKMNVQFYFEFLKDEKKYVQIWIFAFCFYFNFFAIIIHFLAYYFYFTATLDLKHIYIFLYKILFDLMPMFKFVPLFLWIIIFFKLFHIFRKNVADGTFEHYENRNKGFVNSLGQQTMVVGPPGLGKTQLMTDMNLSQEVIFRDKSLSKILGYDNMFPFFPFINLELEIKRALQYHEIFNLASAKNWIRKKIQRSYKVAMVDDKPEYIFKEKALFGYDYNKYPLAYFNGFKEIHLFDMLQHYTQVYYIYTIESSLIVSNYSIRSDNYFDSIGNFPVWHSGFFNNDPNYVDAVSRYSHILDFDAMRLFKKVDPSNPVIVDIGVISFTEGGKERGNQLENRSFKKDSDTANPLNDGTNQFFKMARHNSTVDNDSFLKITLDDQRPESLGADARDLCEKIVHIKKKSEYMNALILFRLEFMIYSFIKSKWESIYIKYRYYRSDNTLLFFILKILFNTYFKYINRLYNRYGYYISTLATESGTMDDELETNKYYLMFPKIFADRYSTDCFSDFFFNKNINSKIGINDLREFGTSKATIEELSLENSFFIIDLIKHNL